MADGGFGHGATVTRRFEGALMVFQRLDGLWMIDRLGAPANEQCEGDEEACDEACEASELDLATAIAREELAGLTESERRAFHARQLRKLGLHEGGTAASALWRIITDFDRFDPWAA